MSDPGATPHDPTILPSGLPVPQDDGAARHLAGLKLPSIKLTGTDGTEVDLAKLAGRTVLYIYPRTGVPGQPLPEGWDGIPGARGLTLSPARFGITSQNSSAWESRTFMAFPPKIVNIRAKQPDVFACPLRSSPMPISS